ncbi:MAG: heme o synthase [Acidobacteriota bacterium]
MTAEATTLDQSSQWADFMELTKPRITMMVALTTAAGFLLASPRPLDWDLLAHTLLGTALVASAASALNQIIERRTDARMRRTANRPIPAGRLGAEKAFAFALVLTLAGAAYLAFAVNLLTALVGMLTLGSYVLIYTPLKRKSSLATIVGAFPGAAPPMMGCTAATGEIGLLAWILFGILFLWQMPHFLAIAWLYRSDYERGGFPMLTLGENSGQRTSRQMVLYAAALIPVSLLPSAFGYLGLSYFVGALILGLAFLGYCFAFGMDQDARAARRLLLASVVYLPVVLLLMVADQAFRL